MTKKAFLTEYKQCADEETLKKIWQSKIDRDIILDLQSCSIYDLSPFKGFDHLERLFLSSPAITDLKPLEGLFLKELFIDNTLVKDVSPLKKLPTLKRMSFNSTFISDLSPLKKLYALHSLYLNKMPIEDLSPLKDLLLTVLECSHTNIKDLSPLNSTRSLNISNSKVSDLTPMKNIKSVLLNASSTEVTDLSPLKDFPCSLSLRFLNISSTQVSDIQPLKELSRLLCINISNTLVTDLRPLEDIINQEISSVNWQTLESMDCGIYVENCPLINPPIEVVKKGKIAILDYWGVKPNFDVNVERRKLIIRKKKDLLQ
jgi:hypothetical protein